MRLISFLIVIILPFFVQAQTDVCLKNCEKYTKSFNKGKTYIDAEPKRYSKAIFEFLAAETAARECNCNSDEINKYIREAIKGLEAEKEAAIKAKLAEEKAKKDAIAMRTNAINAKIQAERQTKKLQVEQAKANRLKTLIESIDDDNYAYQFLYDEGITYFEDKDYKNALVYFADAEFLGGAINDSIKVLINKSKIGISANRNFYAGYLDTARVEYLQAMNSYVDSLYCFEHIKAIDYAYKVFYRRINGKDLDSISLFNLHEKNLKCLPAKIGQLKNLRKMYLSKNELTSLPAEIEQLNNLTYLDLYDNQLTSLPAEIEQLNNLTYLDLYDNQLTSLLAEIGQLNNLTYLYLGNNQLTNLPAGIGQLTNLKELDLRTNQLTSLPTEIGQLNNLTYLYLGKNELTSLPAKIGQLNSLTHLYLGNNQLTSLPAEVGQLNNLTELKLYDNQLTSLPAEIGRLNNLTKLRLSSNQLTSLPAEIGQLNNLTELYLYGNQLTSLPAEIKNLQNLTILYLGGNNFSEAERKKIENWLPNCKIEW